MGAGAAVWILPLAGYNCEVQGDAMSTGCKGWGAERAHECYLFPPFPLPAKMGATEILRSRMQRKVDFGEVESKWLKRGTLT